MVQYYFVKVPRGVKIYEARNMIKDACDCWIKNAARFCFFVRVNSGSLNNLTQKAYENGEHFIVEEAKSINDSNWDTIRQPKFIRPRGNREFKAFAIIHDMESFEKHMRELMIKYIRIDQVEGKSHSFIIFNTLEEAKGAVKTYKDNRHENDIVRQFIPYHIRKNFK